MARRLAAILAADVVGYSRLMEIDEAGTLAALKAHRGEFIDPLITEHGGRIVKLMGDGALVEFPSVVEAVDCAVVVQLGMAERNACIPHDKRIEFRIGINLGDIMIEGDDIYGDGVNVAARIEALAEPGGITVSGYAHDHVAGKVEFVFEDTGTHELKNIVRPIRVFRIVVGTESEVAKSKKPTGPRRSRYTVVALIVGLVLCGGAIVWWQVAAPDFQPATVEDMAFELPDKPSLVVLPFESGSGDPNDDLLADGMSESLAAKLSKIPNLFLIDQHSASLAKDTSQSVKEVAEALGVRYVLEGSLRRDQNHLRVTATLSDALGGHLLWAQEYDRGVADIFAIQDDIAERIVTAMEVTLTEGAQAGLWRRETENAEAYELFLRGTQLFRTFSKLEVAQAQHLYNEALAIDPSFEIARVHLGWTYILQARYYWVEDTSSAWERAKQIAEEVLASQPDHPDALTLLGFYYMYGKDFDAAVPLVEKAVSIDPNNAINVAALGRLMNVVGRPQEGVNLVQQAMRLSPYYPAWFLRALGNGYQLLGEYDKAAEALETCLERNPDISEARATLAYVYYQLGDEDKARAAASELMRRNPDYSMVIYQDSMPNKNAEVLTKILDVLQELGIP